jgi:transcriptional regulator with GAF, ATPase, and Fis domain
MTSLQQLRRRRAELFLLLVSLLVLTVATTIVSAINVGQWLLAGSLAILSILFCAYIAEREMKIRTLSQQLLEEEMSHIESEARTTILNNKIKELTALRAALEALAMEQRPEQALNTILNAACQLCGAPRGSIMLADTISRRFVIAVSKGLKPEYLTQVQGLDHGVAGQVVATGEPLLLSGQVRNSSFTHFIEKDAPLRSSVCVPLRLRGLIIGVLNCSLVGTESRNLTEYDLQLMSLFAHYAVLVLDRAKVRWGATPRSATLSAPPAA